MSDLTIKTNNVPRDVLCWWDLTKKEQAEFDYLDSEGRQNEAQFFRYKKWDYDLGEFVRVVPRSDLVGMEHPAEDGSPLLGWDGICTDSFFSAIVVKWANDYESVTVGLALS
jgi:hypothetical protein